MNWEQADDGRAARWWWAVVAVALVVATVVLAANGRDVDGTLAVQPRAEPSVVATPAPRDATPSAAPVEVTTGDGAVLPDDADFAIVAADGGGWQVVDVATGAVTRWRMTGLRGRTLSRSLFGSGDDLVVNPGLGPADVLRVAPDGRTSRIATRRQVIPTLDAGNAVWVHDGLSDDVGGAASLVDPDGSVRERVELPSLTAPAVGIGDRLVVTLDDGTAVVTSAGSRPIWDRGVIAAADGRKVAHVICDTERQCTVVVGTLDDPDRHRLLLARGDVPGPYFGSGLGAFSPDGRYLAVPVFGRASHGYVIILDARTGERVGRPEGSAQPFTSALAWSPDSTWLVFAAGEGVDAWSAATGGVIKLSTEPVQALATLESGADGPPADPRVAPR